MRVLGNSISDDKRDPSLLTGRVGFSFVLLTMSFPSSEFGFVSALIDHDRTASQVFCAPADTGWVRSEPLLGEMQEPHTSGVVAVSVSVPPQTPQAEQLPVLESSITLPTLVALRVRLQV